MVIQVKALANQEWALMAPAMPKARENQVWEQDLAAKGVRLVDEQPRQGAHGRVAFLHPKSAHGVLIELIEKGAQG